MRLLWLEYKLRLSDSIQAPSTATCSVLLLVLYFQAINLIGKHIHLTKGHDITISTYYSIKGDEGRISMNYTKLAKEILKWGVPNKVDMIVLSFVRKGSNSGD